MGRCLATLAAGACVWPVLAAGAEGAAPRLHVSTENVPPASILKDGKVVGRATEKIELMMARAGVAIDITMLPWQRAYSSAKLRQDGCVYPAARSPEREAMFKWVGPVSLTEWVLYGTAQRQLRLASLEDARPFKIAAYLGDATEQFLQARGFKVESVANDALNPNKLLGNRVDLWASTPARAGSYIRQAHAEGKIVQLLSYNKVPLYLACNPAVPTPWIDNLNAILAHMERDGSIKAIDEKYARWPQP
ncbi:MAG: ABC transporter substrate-binding protein [Pseudomonadota bacterium]